VALGLEILNLAMIHEKALIAHAISMESTTARDRILRRAGKFFAEAIVPMEETHRTALESNAQMSKLNLALKRRAQQLSTSNRELKREIAKRRAVEESLRKSEQDSRRLLDQSRRMQEQMRLLSRRLLSVQEDERKRISRELHDVVAQMLTGINVQLATLKTEATADAQGLGRRISRTQRLVEKSVENVHRFAGELRPAVLDDLGLIPALHSHLKTFRKETGLRASLTAFAGVESLSGGKRTALYRVAQEALTNVARHARATRVEVSIHELPRAIRMQIKDDGTAFDVDGMWHAGESRHLGMLGMRERTEIVGGTFTVESALG